MSDNLEVLLNQFIENTDSVRNLTSLYEWVNESFNSYTTDSFKTPVFMSESLNHLHYWFVQITDLLRNKTNVLLAGQLQLIIFIWTIWTIFISFKKKMETVYTEKGFSLYSAALQLFLIILKTWHSSSRNFNFRPCIVSCRNFKQNCMWSLTRIVNR